MTDRRQVRVTEQFFDRLDEPLPEEPSATGTPSTTDFLLHDMPRIIDLLAENYEGTTVPVDDEPRIRMLIAGGTLVRFVAVYAILGSGGTVELVSLELDR